MKYAKALIEERYTGHDRIASVILMETEEDVHEMKKRYETGDDEDDIKEVIGKLPCALTFSFVNSGGWKMCSSCVKVKNVCKSVDAGPFYMEKNGKREWSISWTKTNKPWTNREEYKEGDA